MKRREFLAQLKCALENDMSAQAVRENVDYYNQYIEDEMKNGKTEQEVIDMLGDPWAIAKTILMSVGMGGQEYSSDTADVQEKEDTQNDYQGNPNIHVFGLDSWWKKAALLAVVIAVIFIILSIVFGIISFIAPIAVPVLVIVLVIRMFKKR